ncbi:MAG TPA: hypothetical protein VF445_07835, partial [Bordetella sp.]|uniref:hypothetical protein n=1 Tax=Bordetella sp. TaxID=28081 RepID=UPI002ED35641
MNTSQSKIASSHLICHSHIERLARLADKERRLLGFLSTEIFTTPRIAADVMRLANSKAAWRTFQRLERNGLIVQDSCRHPGGYTVKIIGITMAGQARAAELLGKQYVNRGYERGRVSLQTIFHREDLQALRLSCARAGWREWTYLDRIRVTQKSTKDSHRADIIARHPAGQRVAIEVERTIKTTKRYRAIAARHLEAMSRGEYAHVI